FSWRTFVDLLPLPSFPTRRSSDLVLLELGEHLARQHPDAVHRLVVAEEARLSGHQQVPEAADGLVKFLELPEHLVRRAGEHDALDRKSTRLNSSHQLISYAVFRLK